MGVRDRLRMSLLPLDQTLTLTPVLTAGDIMVDTIVLIIMVTGMAKDKLRMRPLPLGQTLTLTPILMAGDTGEDTTVHTTEVTTGENKIAADTKQNIFHQTVTLLHRWWSW